MTTQTIYLGNNIQHALEAEVAGEYVNMLGESFYRISNYDAMTPFFMGIVSNSDHWLFISSSGGLSAGRVNTEKALFPFYTEDKLTENSDNTGHRAILLATSEGHTQLWEPFTDRYRGIYKIERNLYKNIPGNTVVFEEINRDLGLTYRYAWRTSVKYGFVKTSWLTNIGKAGYTVELLDGLQNLLPANITLATQTTFSILLDAYKYNELEPETGLGIFALSSTLTDLAEPSESLLATTVWQSGLEEVEYLLSSTQLQSFREGRPIQPEREIKGQRSAYFVHTTLELPPNTERTWNVVAEIGLDHAAVAALINELKSDRIALCERLKKDIQAGSAELMTLVGSADGLQVSGNPLVSASHFANVMFNIMRGGMFADQYQIDRAELREYVAIHNRGILKDFREFFEALPATIPVSELRARADLSNSADLIRLCYGYLPLTFSRRHGDPSRPWNRFSINVRKPDGSRQLSYEGNWRDIFQNWEPLAYSYPEFIEGMLGTFLNATTADGYNPYRITSAGIDWEVPEPENPWANIGYWSDHQIIYLLKLLEICEKFYPQKLGELLNRAIFSHANVPYRIKSYAELLADPYNTIDFDWELEHKIEKLVEESGTDGKLVLDANGKVFHVTLAEKLLTLLFSKLVNFVPEGGIWMNTQRPEWNDANNALVGNGLSVVTLGYLYRYLTFCTDIFSRQQTLRVTVETQSLFEALSQIFVQHHPLLRNKIDDTQRKIIMDQLGQAGSDYRWNYYRAGLKGELCTIETSEIVSFLRLAQEFVAHSLKANLRSDKLFHSYNILQPGEKVAAVAHLYEMLEGQVAILSSGLLDGEESLDLLRSLRNSALYRADQHSYMLYPNRKLPGFLQKNCITETQVKELKLVAALLEHNDSSLIVRDVNGSYHFNSHFRNAKDVVKVLTNLGQQAQYAQLVRLESEKILGLFEQTFNHKAFTGRSGTFFAYEGLGSIYWHMVSKLTLAVQETIFRAQVQQAPLATLRALVEVYNELNTGSNFNKSPLVYGAFPTDPYSHTPEGQGVKQPGMTGMVKEEILVRMGVLGVTVEQGELVFNSLLLQPSEYSDKETSFSYVNLNGEMHQLGLTAGTLAYTFCQIPIILQAAQQPKIIVTFSDGTSQTVSGNRLGVELSQRIFRKDGSISQLRVMLP